MWFCITFILSQFLAETAAGAHQFAGDPLRVIGSEKGCDRRNVIDLAETTEGSLRHCAFLEVTADEACGVDALGLDHSRVDRVDADLPRTKLLGENAGDGVDRPLGAGIDRGGWRSAAADYGTDVDDARALAEVRHRRPGGEQKAKDVDIEDFVELGFGDVLDRRELVNAG